MDMSGGAAIGNGRGVEGSVFGRRTPPVDHFGYGVRRRRPGTLGWRAVLSQNMALNPALAMMSRSGASRGGRQVTSGLVVVRM
jgi:hypothetical protein